MHAKTDADNHIIAAIEAGGAATADEFDIDAIADELYEAVGGSWDLTNVDNELFWAAVERNAR